jgi:hypothetical protein
MESKIIPKNRENQWVKKQVPSVYVNNAVGSGILDLRIQDIVPNAKVSIGTIQIGRCAEEIQALNAGCLEMF